MELAGQIADAAIALPDIDEPGFAEVIDRFADARIVLLGEASHGTSEFYRARAAFTQRLIAEHGFNIVAVEADWPDAAAIDRHVRHRPPREDFEPFARFPTWMWRNREVDAFVDWLRDWNGERAPQQRTGFYGLDLYNFAGSIAAVIEYLDKVDPEAAAVARKRYACLFPYRDNPARYGAIALSEGHARCERAVVEMLADLFAKSRDYGSARDDDFLDAAQNARLVAGAEAYYRVMYHGSAESWNLRDRHMFDTLDLLLAAKGEQSKAVVWAHNSHVGDARATDMGRERDELNIGQLCREHYGAEALLVGFGTHTGTVAAADDWDEPMQVKRVQPSLPDSYEAVCHAAGLPRFFLDPAAVPALSEARLERYIGVIYRPETERLSQYSESVLPLQYDGWVWFDETRAVTPSGGNAGEAGADETYPFGL